MSVLSATLPTEYLEQHGPDRVRELASVLPLSTGHAGRLRAPQTHVQEMDGQRVAVTLGPWPEAGDLSRGNDLPAYRELARALEPWLKGFEPPCAFAWSDAYTEEDARRWWRRFLE